MHQLQDVSMLFIDGTNNNKNNTGEPLFLSSSEVLMTHQGGVAAKNTATATPESETHNANNRDYCSSLDVNVIVPSSPSSLCAVGDESQTNNNEDLLGLLHDARAQLQQAQDATLRERTERLAVEAVFQEYRLLEEERFNKKLASAVTTSAAQNTDVAEADTEQYSNFGRATTTTRKT